MQKTFFRFKINDHNKKLFSRMKIGVVYLYGSAEANTGSCTLAITKGNC